MLSSFLALASFPNCPGPRGRNSLSLSFSVSSIHCNLTTPYTVLQKLQSKDLWWPPDGQSCGCPSKSQPPWPLWVLWIAWPLYNSQNSVLSRTLDPALWLVLPPLAAASWSVVLLPFPPSLPGSALAIFQCILPDIYQPSPLSWYLRSLR